MRILLNTFRWYDRPWAAFIFFTRLPFWRIHQPPRSCYNSVVEFWPLVGWLTGGVAAAVIYFGSMLFPVPVAVILAFALRMLLTGALHEDGLGDFFDGFGGGCGDRRRILEIMKDSRTGTYGVMGLVGYGLLLTATLSGMSASFAAFMVLVGDPFCKMVAAQMISMMPYARNENEAKARVVYRKVSLISGIGLLVQGALPLVVFLLTVGNGLRWDLLIFPPCVVMYFLYLIIWRKLRGYTGDCCGAVFLLTELSFYLSAAYQFYNYPELWKLFL